MYYNEFDFVKFFDDKYKSAKTQDKQYSSEGIGAVGIITHNQMILRVNQPEYDIVSKKYVSGLGHHYVEEDIIYREIYDILNNDFNQLYPETYLNLNPDIIREITCGNIRLRMINNELFGNTIIIELPIVGKITSNQIIALEKLSDMIEDAYIKSKIEIDIKVFINNDEIEELNTIRNKILPKIKEMVDDTYEPIIEDKIITTEFIENDKLHL